MALTFGRAFTKEHLEQILSLQTENHISNLTQSDISNEGFLTAKHTFDQLKQINDAENAVVAFDNDKIVAYAIAMKKEACPLEMTVFKDLFDTLENLSYKEKKLSEYKMILVGQLCVDKAYRGQGIVPKLYKTFKEILSKKYDIAVTDISEKNPRSFKAHQKSGFEEIHTFFDNFSSTNWHIVAMDFTK